MKPFIFIIWIIFISILNYCRRSFLRGQLIIWQLYIAWFIFVMVLVTAYIISTLVLLLYQSLLATQTENMVRPMMFPLWLPADDPYRTPNYEIFFLVEAALCFIVPQTFCGTCSFIIIMYLFIVNFECIGIYISNNF